MSQWFGRRVCNSVNVLRVAIIASALILPACSKSPSAPSEPNFLGQWQGSITNDAVGAGTLRLAVSQEVASPQGPLLAGTFTVMYPTPGFDASGAMSAGPVTTDSQFGLFLDRALVPCPGEPGGTALRAVLATVTLSNGHITGRYVSAGCAGGAIDIHKQ